MNRKLIEGLPKVANWIAQAPEPNRAAKRPGRSSPSIDDFVRQINNLRALNVPNLHTDEAIQKKARAVAGPDKILEKRLCIAVGVKPSNRLTSKIRRQQSNLAHDHGPRVFQRNQHLVYGFEKFTKKVIEAAAKNAEPNDYDIAAYLRILVFTEHGITSAELAEQILHNTFNDTFTFRLGSTVYTEATLPGFTSSKDQPTHRIALTPVYRALAADLRNRGRSLASVRKLLDTRDVHRNTDKLLDLFEIKESDLLNSRLEDFGRLIFSEINVKIPVTLQRMHAGTPVCAPLPRHEFIALSYDTRRPLPGFEYHQFFSVNAKSSAEIARTAEFTEISTEAEFKSLLIESGERAHAKTGSKAKAFQKELGLELEKLVDIHAHRFDLWHNIILAFAIGFAEYGLTKQRDGVLSTYKRYLEEVVPVGHAVFQPDEKALDDMSVLALRLERALNERTDRRYAEPRIDLMFQHAETYGYLDAPPPGLIYKGRHDQRLPRAEALNAAAYARLIETLYTPGDPVAEELTLYAIFQRRFGLRAMEAFNLQYQDVSSHKKRWVVAPQTRGHIRLKTEAANRWVTLFSELTEIEHQVLCELLNHQRRGARAKNYIFRPANVAEAHRYQRQLQGQLRNHLKNVTGNSNATLHGALRKSFIAEAIAAAVGITKSTEKIAGESSHSDAPLPPSLKDGGKRHMNVPMGIASQAGHTTFTQTTLTNYFHFGSEVFQQLWSERATVTFPQRRLRHLLGQPDLSRDEARLMLRAVPNCFEPQSLDIKHFRSSKAKPQARRRRPIKLTEIAQLLGGQPLENLPIGHVYDNHGSNLTRSIRTHAIELMPKYEINRELIGLSQDATLSDETPLIELRRQRSIVRVLAMVETSQELKTCFGLSGPWTKAILHHRGGTYLYIKAIDDAQALLSALETLGFGREHIICQAPTLGTASIDAKTLGLDPIKLESKFTLARKEDAFVLRILQNRDAGALVREPRSLSIAAWLTGAFITFNGRNNRDV
ncbi:site-specific integrase [Congregibacter litoralis]|uniref:Uncharacterized protein n=1 Tax=Congregibacter litoralis KT71 TaxID=314285 RepID=A4A4I9_9GAMM|nr:site-specific integrase [Congregibacter litoralis]EAQ98710.1 hypothetical protein KT71_08792 [Congregibacter litoralis KT71]